MVLLRQNIEALYLALLRPDEIPWEVTTLREWVIFLAGLFSFALGAFVFYKITSRIIKAESQRRVQ